MSAHAMKPTFKDKAGYLQWRKQWRVIMNEIAQDIRRSRARLVEMQRTRPQDEATRKAQKELGHKRIMAWKMMSLLDEARLRRDRIMKMVQQLAEQRALFPLVEPDCRVIDFHFNKGHLEFPQLPMWVVKTKGKTFYVDHVEASVPWTTKETPDHASTKGAIRLRNCRLHIDKEGTAKIS